MRKIWFFFLFLFLNSSCEPDDVCSEANPSTPQLVFRLYDSSQPNELKAVDTLRIMSLGDQAQLEFINTDSIVCGESCLLGIQSNLLVFQNK